jgi:hypothetical protein
MRLSRNKGSGSLLITAISSRFEVQPQNFPETRDKECMQWEQV